jgi:hypothetical protein
VKRKCVTLPQFEEVKNEDSYLKGLHHHNGFMCEILMMVTYVEGNLPHGTLRFRNQRKFRLEKSEL